MAAIMREMTPCTQLFIEDHKESGTNLSVIMSFHLFPSSGSLIIFPLLIDFPVCFLASHPWLLTFQITATLTFAPYKVLCHVLNIHL